MYSVPPSTPTRQHGQRARTPPLQKLPKQLVRPQGLDLCTALARRLINEARPGRPRVPTTALVTQGTVRPTPKAITRRAMSVACDKDGRPLVFRVAPIGHTPCLAAHRCPPPRAFAVPPTATSPPTAPAVYPACRRVVPRVVSPPTTLLLRLYGVPDDGYSMTYASSDRTNVNRERTQKRRHTRA